MQENNLNSFESSLLKYGIDLGLIVAGFFGALLLAMRSKNQTIGRAICTIIAGAIAANYLTPIVLNFAPEYIRENGKYGTAFLMGFIGLKSLEIVYDAVANRVKNKKGRLDIDIHI